MSIFHKNIQSNWKNGFATHNAILDMTLYNPEILFIGTFNPGTENDNFSDFFYGRNYFWTAFKNYFIHNKIQINKRRMPTNGRKSNSILDPEIAEIFTICTRLKLSFADLILKVLYK